MGSYQFRTVIIYNFVWHVLHRSIAGEQFFKKSTSFSLFVIFSFNNNIIYPIISGVARVYGARARYKYFAPTVKNWWWPALRAFNLWQCFLAPLPPTEDGARGSLPLALWLRHCPLFTFSQKLITLCISHYVIHVIECKIVSYRAVSHCTCTWVL